MLTEVPVQDVFRTFVATLLARVNTLTGVTYRWAMQNLSKYVTADRVLTAYQEAAFCVKLKAKA